MSRIPSWASAALLLAAAAFSGAPADAQYNTEIQRWSSQDNLDPPVEGGLVFTGSSSIRRWEQLTRDFADYNVIQRGIGGALLDDVVARVDDLVLKYNPRGVVVWAGTNDLAVGSDGAEVLQDYQDFVAAVHGADPDVEIFYLGIMPTPGRQGNRPQEDLANGGIRDLAAGDPKLHYIDLPGEFEQLGPYGGAEFHSKFVDSIHLNREGYDFWTSVIRPQVSAVLSPDKPLAANPNALTVGQSLLFDFGPVDTNNGRTTSSPDPAGLFWNNWRGISGGATINAGEHFGNLVNTLGDRTGVDLTLTAGFMANGRLHGGLLSADPSLLGDLGVATATEDFFFSTGDGLQGGGDDDTAGGFMLDGLDPGLLYEFKFFGSRNTAQERVTEYRVTGANDQSERLTTSGTDTGANGIYDGNDSRVAVVADVIPDAYGQVFVDLTLISGDFAYINAMQVTATGVVPEPSSALGAAIGAAAAGVLRRGR